MKASPKESSPLPLKMDLVKKIYFLSLIGTLIPMGMEYYSQASEFVDDGSLEGILYFFGNLGAMVVVGTRAFEFGADKIKKLSHLALLFIAPLVFIQMEVETYLEESPSFIAFDKWMIFYTKGLKEFYGQRDIKKVQYYFQKSIQDLKDQPEAEYLVMKSQIYLTTLEARVGQKEKALKALDQIYNNYPKGDTHELALVLGGLGTLYNHFEKYDLAQPFLVRCLEIYKTKKLKDKELGFQCRYEMTRNHLVNEELEDAKPLLQNLFTFKGPKHLQVDKKLLILTDRLFELKQIDLSLDYYLNLLERFRASKENQVILQIYSRLAEIYSSRGNEARAEIYLNFKRGLTEEGGAVVPQE